MDLRIGQKVHFRTKEEDYGIWTVSIIYENYINLSRQIQGKTYLYSVGTNEIDEVLEGVENDDNNEY